MKKSVETGGVRGKYVGEVAPLDKLALIDAEVFAGFTSDEALNQALRLLQRASVEALRRAS